ncbi:MAG: dTDP-4-dehydrorhamnose 3,5-epimerase [Moraxella sp.]|uniref:dTDP-4-dehydrorhamnose 3,5-epimerase n=1 Tax=Moraxella sp. TaxID=479 RepID=UPI0026DABAB3|nr:dTDP-4-dehydrorhamnose 3,5-epimerase [Moraxella sp.]MDO4449452.1 dTDP-4-dehydrorhamnose 3,5-epimerase [Moraxella sp.]
MNIIETKIPELLIFEPKVFNDERGCFFESFNQKTFETALKERGFEVPTFVQDNHSISKKGVLRGLHYQLPPFAQGKLVRVVQGRAFDVAVDIRKNSPTFGQWVGVELTADNHRQFWVPAGFAHGFVALEDNTQFLYKTTNFYDKNSERSIVWNDVDLNIDWGIDSQGLIINEKDREASPLKNAEIF